MKPWRWFDRYQTGRADFVRIHRQVIRVGFWGAASVFFALRSLMVPDGTLIDSAVVAHLLLFAPLFFWSSIRPSLMPVLILFLAVLLLLLYDTGSQSHTLRRLLLDYGHPTAYLPLLVAYAAHLWYMAVHPFVFVRPRDFATYGVGYLGSGLQPRDTGYASAEEEEEDEDEGLSWMDKLNKEYWLNEEYRTVHDPTLDIWRDRDH